MKSVRGTIWLPAPSLSRTVFPLFDIVLFKFRKMEQFKRIKAMRSS